MALIVDTGVFISLERRQRPWQEFLAAESAGELTAIAAITASELLAGVYKADTPTRRSSREQHINEILASLPVLSFDLAAAREHARLWALLDSLGQPIGRYDMLIAATALANGSAVLTDNVREFGRIPDLEVRRPHW